MMRRIMSADDSQVVAQVTGVRDVDMELMAMAPMLARELKTCTGHLLRVASQPENQHLTEYVQHLEGPVGRRLWDMGVRK